VLLCSALIVAGAACTGDESPAAPTVPATTVASTTTVAASPAGASPDAQVGAVFDCWMPTSMDGMLDAAGSVIVGTEFDGCADVP
jgi:hypothetical protein